jgi:hypothetical protein
MTVIKESVKDSSEEKQYYLDKLKSLNTVAKDLSQQEKIITEVSEKYRAKKKDDDD